MPKTKILRTLRSLFAVAAAAGCLVLAASEAPSSASGPQRAPANESVLAKLADPEILSSPTPLTRAQLPAAIATLLTAVSHGGDLVFEHRRILAYEIELDTGHGFETEIFVDGGGRTLITIVKPDGRDLEQPETFDSLPPPARDAIRALLGDTSLVRLQREIEWGLPVHAAKWDGSRGTQELKVLDDGRILFIELPGDESIPDAVLRLAAGATVEALLLDVFVATDRSRPADRRVVLAAGWPLATAVVE